MNRKKTNKHLKIINFISHSCTSHLYEQLKFVVTFNSSAGKGLNLVFVILQFILCKTRKEKYHEFFQRTNILIVIFLLYFYLIDNIFLYVCIFINISPLNKCTFICCLKTTQTCFILLSLNCVLYLFIYIHTNNCFLYIV